MKATLETLSSECYLLSIHVYHVTSKHFSQQNPSFAELV